MLRFQIALAIILVGCVAFIACERGQQMLDPADMIDTSDDMTIGIPMDYMSWMHVMLDAPMPMADATSPAETGAAHNPAHVETGITTPRTVYINDIGVMANKEGTMYPDGTVIVKEIMDDTNMFVDKVAVMMKNNNPMYAGHNGWVYSKYVRSSVDAEYMQVRGSNLEDAGNGCHGCHVKAGEGSDSVFVSLPKDQMMDNTMDNTMEDTTMNDGGSAGDDNGDAAGDAQ